MKFINENGKLHTIVLNETDVKKITTMFTSQDYGYDWRETVAIYVKREKNKCIDLTNIWIYYEKN